MTSSRSGDPRLLATFRTTDGEGLVRVEDRFAIGIDNVWEALTDPNRLVKWLGEVEGDLRVGGEFRARFYASGWEGTGRVDACEAPHHLRVLTREPDDPKESPIEVTLTSDEDGTIVVWQEGAKPVDLLAAYGAGIQIHVEDLADYIAGRERRAAASRFDELFATYRQTLGERGSG